jgi:GT2 family glycosyltransferase
MISYSVCVTSCDRHDLLRETLTTFAATCDQCPVETVIVEDSAKGEPDWLRSINGLGRVRWLSNGGRVGQLYSCDRLWQETKTDWVFWLEDDWKFTEHRYFEKSYEIMRENPDILTCNIRSDWHHPLVADPKGQLQNRGARLGRRVGRFHLQPRTPAPSRLHPN